MSSGDIPIIDPDAIAKPGGSQLQTPLRVGDRTIGVFELGRELLPDVDEWTLTILGTDVNTDALDRARKATYGEWAFREERAKQWRAKWPDIITLFDFPAPIRKAIYTTNAIESVNSVIRKFTRNRKIYPNEESALKLIYMAIQEASKRWTMPIRRWKEALNHFAIMFEDRMPDSHCN